MFIYRIRVTNNRTGDIYYFNNQWYPEKGTAKGVMTRMHKMYDYQIDSYTWTLITYKLEEVAIG